MIKHILILFTILAFVLTEIATAQEQTFPQTSILFTSEDAANSRVVLFSYDAASQKTVELYSSNTFIQFLNWSPSGSLFTILTNMDNRVVICVLDRAGKVKSCTTDEPRQLALSLTWSKDERNIYFIVGGPDKYELLESDTNSGKTVRIVQEIEDTLYQTTQNYTARILWSVDLSKIVVNRGIFHSEATMQIDTASTRKSQLIDNIVTPFAVFPTAVDSDYGGRSVFHRLLACQLSLSGQFWVYLDAHDGHIEETPQTRSRKLRFEVRNSADEKTVLQVNYPNAIPESCDQIQWSHDEMYIFYPYREYLGSGNFAKRNIYRSEIATGKVETIVDGTRVAQSINSSFSVSPKGDEIAFITQTSSTEQEQLGIIGSENSIRYFSGPLKNTTGFLWVPPLKN